MQPRISAICKRQVARVFRRNIHVNCVEDLEGGTSKYQAALFIDNVFPLKIARVDVRPYLMQRSMAAKQSRVEAMLPADLPHKARVSKIDPQMRDGGGLVHFTVAADSSESARQAARDVVQAVNEHVQQHCQRWWTQVRALGVRGEPFCEDIVRMLPAKRVRVEFCGPALDTEQLFKEFRPFGRIVDIEVGSSSAIVRFARLRGATSARACVHGDVVGATRLRVSYAGEDHEHLVMQWLKEHSKFTVPLAAAALIAAIYAVFDPIREFCVENKITHRFDLARIPLIGDVRRVAMRSLLRREPARHDDMSAWTGLADQGARLESILDDPPESFIVVVGPHGSGKARVVEQATRGKKYRIEIDAHALAAGHSELEQMTQLAHQLGWWPVFNSIISITSAIDVMATAATGSSAGISATPESQVRRILETLALVLANIRHERKQAHLHSASHASAPVHALPPEDVPVIVFDSLLDADIKFAPVILDWATSIVEAGLAHCIITATSISGYHEVQRAQPQNAASLISLNDASPMEAVTLLQKQLVPSLDPTNQEASESVNESIAHAATVLGGRLEDLQLFVQKVRAGESGAAALESIVQRAITEVRKYAFSDDSEVGQCEHTWTPEQFWFLLTELAQRSEIEYDRIRSSALFAGKDDALLGLAEAQLITMVYNHDRPARIRPGRPVYAAAFERILQDPGFACSMTVKMNKKFVDLETAKIRAAEDELALLNVFRASADAHAALTSGMAVIAASQAGYRHGSSSWSRSDPFNPEAFIAQAANTSARNASGSSDSLAPAHKPHQSWTAWLKSFFVSSPSAAAPHDKSETAAYSCSSLVPGIPFELQGRVQFLLRSIHASQQKIDRWDAQSQEMSRRLASL
ncbi:mitochondrial escape protein 2 [Coemansia brasiliensis]|uniref:Mitochondrial escape protein 2 n=1 Tax=Coemansia brasiliensis TaxID=2650707 RepID=A0A9W8I738_9FUNG|nr:mitochondrial escape protein 2 [Coemansia brasiliensis]